MDFACKQIDVEQVIKCSFNLSKAGCAVLRAVLSATDWVTSEEVATRTGYDLATIQRSLKQLFERDAVLRRQINREGGGFEYVYHPLTDDAFVALVSQTLDSFRKKAVAEITSFTKKVR